MQVDKAWMDQLLPPSILPTRVRVHPGQALLMKGHLLHAGAPAEPGKAAVRLHLDLQRMGSRANRVQADTTYLANPHLASRIMRAAS